MLTGAADNLDQHRQSEAQVNQKCDLSTISAVAHQKDQSTGLPLQH